MRRRLNRKTASDGGLKSDDLEEKTMDTEASRKARLESPDVNPATTVEVILSLDNKHDFKCVTRCDRQRDGDVAQIQGLSSGVTFGSPRFAVASNALDF